MKYLEKYGVHGGGGGASRIYIIWDRLGRSISGAYLVHIWCISMYSCKGCTGVGDTLSEHTKWIPVYDCISEDVRGKGIKYLGYVG